MNRALVSTSDKTGLIEFLKPLLSIGLEVVSTGGTLAYLKENGIKASDVSEVTNFPEVLDGRVKTLHPLVHMGLLADQRKKDHKQQLAQHKVRPFDLVVGNLYPFEKSATDEKSSLEDLIEKIDIGGPSFLRAAAKNYHSVLVLCDPNDYQQMQHKILNQEVSIDDRKRMALKVFSLTSYYDALIFNKLSENLEINTPYLNLPLKKQSALRYGENAHQKAFWFTNPLNSENLAHALIHQGKELSYNNLLDIDAAVGLVRLFSEPSCVAVKHNNPCGVGQGRNTTEALIKTIQADPKSIFGGILAFNEKVDLSTIESLKDIFLECLIAPEYTSEALQALTKKKNLRVLSWPEMKSKSNTFQYKSILGGLLQQSMDHFLESTKDWIIYGHQPSQQQKLDILFGEKVCASLKSNAITIVSYGQTLGLGMGQVNRVDAVQQALSRFEQFKKNNNLKIEDVVLISDAFFPFADSIEIISKAGIQWVVQPGGSTKDNEVIEAAKNHKINMIFTHQRHFRH